MRLSRRVAELPAASTIAMAQRARALRATGVDVISLALGEPDFPSPDVAAEAAARAAREGDTRYPPVAGTDALKAAIVEKFRRDNGLEYAANEIIVSNGGKQVIFNAFMATLDPGDEVVVPAPYWVSYPLIAQMMGAVPVPVPCLEADGFRLRADALRAALTPRTRWLVLNFPSNPTGAVMDAADLASIAAVLRDFPDVLVLSDEIYEHLTFGSAPHVSLAAVAPDLKPRILTMNGVAKAYAMTGWRVGFAGGPAWLIAGMARVQGNSTSGICTLAQAGAAAALSGDQSRIALMRETYERRVARAVAALRAMPGITCAQPDGAFYVYPGVAGLIGRRSAGGALLGDDTAIATAILEEAHVSTVAGAGFGMGPHLRISVAASDAQIEEAMARIGRFVDGVS